MLPVCQVASYQLSKLAACSCNCICICINYAAKVILQVVIRPDRHRQKTRRRLKTEHRRHQRHRWCWRCGSTAPTGGVSLSSWLTLWQRLMLLLLLAFNCIFSKRWIALSGCNVIKLRDKNFERAFGKQNDGEADKGHKKGKYWESI